ncbi:MAG: IS4 family transposase, partial [Bifidobacteriaceae bacterium]|nr:IS4 family transposase [Bifidobacteriaceae bacterium]
MQANPVTPAGLPSAPGPAFAPGHLGELTELIPPELVDAALDETRAVQHRVRGLPSRVVVHLLLAACLFPGVGYPGVWRKLAASLPGRAGPSASAMSQARRRLGSAPLRRLFELLRSPLSFLGLKGVWWRGLLVCAVDGTVLTVPDAPGVLPRYKKQAGGAGGKGATGYPQVRLLALVACGTRALVDAVVAPTTTGETTLFPGLARSMRPGMVVLADRNFDAQDVMGAARGAGADFLVRAK